MVDEIIPKPKEKYHTVRVCQKVFDELHRRGFIYGSVNRYLLVALQLNEQPQEPKKEEKSNESQ